MAPEPAPDSGSADSGAPASGEPMDTPGSSSPGPGTPHPRTESGATESGGSAPIDVAHLSFGGIGGHGPIVRMLARQFARHGLHSAVILHAPANDLDADPAHWPHLDQVVAVPLHGKLDLAAMATVARTMRRMRPRVVLCHTHKLIPAVFVGQLLAGRRPRIVIVEHQPIGLRRRVENLRSAIALPLCRAVVVLSDDYERRYPMRRWPLPAVRRLTVIPNGIDTDHITPVEHRAERPFTVGMGCRLIPTKDVGSLVAAVAILVGDLASGDVRLRIAGEGPTRVDLEAQVDRLGLRDHVEFTGQLAEHEMLDFYASIDVYVQATHGETASISLLEAYACGLAVVASDVEGVRGFVHDGEDGLLVAPRDPAALARALASLMADPARVDRLGAAARTRIEADYSAAAMADRYLALLRTLGL
jgi:glycosyltransferase involved in cell wall biosynthesis